MEAKFSDLLGKTLASIVNENEELIFTTTDGEVYKLYHDQDCCESVTIDDIGGDLIDLIGTPLLQAEEVSNKEFEKEFEEMFNLVSEYGYAKDAEGNYKPESYTWTFYKLATIKGYVTIRWLGQSNGYYSEGVTFLKADENGNFTHWD